MKLKKKILQLLICENWDIFKKKKKTLFLAKKCLQIAILLSQDEFTKLPLGHPLLLVLGWVIHHLCPKVPDPLRIKLFKLQIITIKSQQRQNSESGYRFLSFKTVRIYILTSRPSKINDGNYLSFSYFDRVL